MVAFSVVCMEELAKHRRNLADKTTIMTSDFSTTKEVGEQPKQKGANVQAASEGWDLGADRAAEGAAARRTHGAR
eukprot:7329181-Pyramimonas_sp.AAC.1